MTYLKEYQTEPQYQEDKSTLILPNVSLVAEANDVHYNQIIPVTGVTLNKSALELERGGSETLVATVLPSDASNKKVIWNTSDSGIATVDSDGLVTAVAAGNVTITVTTVDGGYSAQCAATITIPLDEQYLTFVAIEPGTFKFNGNSVNYSVDGGKTWITLESDTNSPTISAGSKIMFKATLTPTLYGIGTFSSTGRFTAQGNPMSLLYGDNFIGQTSLSGKSYAFYNLFYNCMYLTSAENMSLPATALVNYCYERMFYGCTSLTTAPSLPATTLAKYCYDSMFDGCTILTTAPELPAITLASGCYQGMFRGCTSLTTAPSLPATTLANKCYMYIFYGCTNLNSITCLATDIQASNCTYNWVDGVAASGTFIKADSMTGWTTGNNGIPTGWTIQNHTL